MAKQVPARNGGTLTRPAKGETMNPHGRPRKLPHLDKLLADCLGGTEMEQVIRALFLRAKKGDTRAAEILLDRGYGKAKQTIDVTTIEEKQVMVIGGQKIEF